MKLKELRKQWEKGLKPLLVMPVIIGTYKKVFVLLERLTKDSSVYMLHRYFQVGDGWEVSVDVQHCNNMGVCIERIGKDKDVVDSYLQLGREDL